MVMRLLDELQQDLQARAASGLLRARRIVESPQGAHLVVDGRRVLAFASNDYLGLANDPQVVAAMRDGVEQWGVGAGASHLLSGHLAPHAVLERALAQFVAPCDDGCALLFSSGYLANLAILTALATRRDAVFADRLNHACLNDGALLSRAALVRYPHADVRALEALLAKSSARHKLIATDAVFSMDGDVAPLRELLRLAERFDALLVVDDAHGFGVLGDGRGSVAHAGLSSERIVVMGTLGKAAGVAGAFVAAHRVVIDTLVQRARSYIYTTAAPPALACAVLRSLDLVRAGGERRAHLAHLIAHFKDRVQSLPWRLLPSDTAIQPLVIGENDAAMALARSLWERGIFAPAIRPPTVPVGTARLRISLSAGHTVTDVDALVHALHDCAHAEAAITRG